MRLSVPDYHLAEAENHDRMGVGRSYRSGDLHHRAGVVESVPTTISRAVIDEVLATIHAGVVSREPRSRESVLMVLRTSKRTTITITI